MPKKGLLYRVTSKERREKRYLRRKAKRQKRKDELNVLFGDYDKDISVKELMDKYWICRTNVSWKPSVQRYGLNLYKSSLKYHKRLLDGEDVFKGFYQFEIYERGKKRSIRSIHISERCIEKSFAVNSYVPIMRNSLIYDNSASLKGRGTDFARRRIVRHLRNWHRHHGNTGYVLVGDFTSFFDSIDHDVLLDIIDRHFTDKRFVEYARNSISHYGDRGLGLGSELNQIFAISVPNRMDQYIKTVLRIKHYHRYNDDFYLLCESKEDAKRILEDIKIVAKSLGITLSERKTYVTKISKGFTFLKKRYILTGSGKTIIKHSRRNLTCERRKLKKFKVMLDRGEMDYKTIEQQYSSWRGYLKHIFSTSKNLSKRFRYEYRTIKEMDKLYNELFINEVKEGGEKCISTSISTEWLSM